MSIVEQEVSGNGQLLQEGTKIPLVGSPSYNELLRYVEEQFSICKQNRLQFERQWYLNVAFYFGKQYVHWSSEAASARLLLPPAPEWRVRLVDNQIRRYIRKENAKATQENPTGFVLPASSEDSDMMAAKAGDAILEYLFREIKVRREINRAVFWAEIVGSGFVKNWYNRANPKKDTVGDLPSVEKIIPWHLFAPDTVQEELESQPYLIQCASKSKEYVKNTYGKEIPGEGRAASGFLEERFLQAMGINERHEKDQVFVKEGWFKPGGYFKDGAVIVWAGSTILFFEDKYPYSHGQFPFSKIDHVPTGRFYGESIITDLIPLQKEYNRTRSQIIEAKNKMAKPQLIAPRGSVDPNKITSQPGLIIFYTPGFEKPEPLPLQALPAYVINELDRNRADMDDISSQHEVSRGQAPPGIEAATAISYLQEQDDSVLSPLVRSIEDATEKLGQHLLFHVNENWDEARKIQVVGLNSQMEAFEFSKANLEGNTDYTVQVGSATPRSQAGKQAFILDAMKSGWIPPAQGFKYLEMAETGKLYEEMQIDVKQAQRENLKMSQGQGLPQPQIDPMTGEPVVDPMTGQPQQIDIQALMMDQNFQGFPTNTWDDDEVHIMEHDNWRKRQEYESSPPEIKFLFELHDRMHKQKLIINYGGMPPATGNPQLDAVLLNSMAYRVMHGIPLAPMGMGAGPEVGAEGGEQQQLPPGG